MTCRRRFGWYLGFGCVVWMTAASAAEPPPNSCLECHHAMEEQTRGPATLFLESDVHGQRGLSCADCHGGDPTSSDPMVAMDPSQGFLGKPTIAETPQFCARCHADPAYMRKYNPNLPTDQYAKYLTSQHGKRLGQGEADVAVCTSCHGVHGIRSKKDPLSPVFPTNIPGTCASCHTDAELMDRHGLPVNQHWEYSQSVHGQALLFRGDRAAPHCASCHGSHEAARPGAIAVGNVCAQCHALTRDLFAASPHKAAHESLGLPECEVCHGNHLIRKPTDEMLGVGPDAVCIGCHEPGSAGYASAQQMREAVERVKAQIAGAEATVKQAGRLGMDVSEAEFELREAETKLTQTRAYVHAFSPSALQPIAEEGQRHARAAEEHGVAAIHEFHFRREGLWITLAVLGLLIAGLLLWIRDLERSDAARPPTPPSPPASP
ncbi:MAG: cytochrome c3 family protein [Candidatus Omnitrophica bacterium]|nr:cytochrome c3 family protein [Candidatus Omnitrophota bacterium]